MGLVKTCAPATRRVDAREEIERSNGSARGGWAVEQKLLAAAEV